MASQQGQNHDRGFREAVLGRCFVQTCTDRFGNGAEDIIRQRGLDNIHPVATEILFQGVPVDQIYTGSPQNGRDAQEPPLEQRIPKMPFYRNNLTALSQRYNLYFAAYENRMFVYRPKGVSKQTLPRVPNLILATKPDAVAICIPGAIDRNFSHIANSIVTGFLGHEEVLVSAYDDGSVFAWYIRHIAEYVEQTSSGHHSQVPVPEYFFSDNVGHSAWGLAVHQKSRLIAVSSNRVEVTVFAFGLSRLPEALERRTPPEFLTEIFVSKRNANWRIVIPLDADGRNIPNIALWDDNEGFAEKIVAVDIDGTLWVLDIWRTRTKPLKVRHRYDSLGPRNFRHSMGWGVAVLPYESFLPAHNSNDLLGLKNSDIVRCNSWIEVQGGLPHIRNHPSLLCQSLYSQGALSEHIGVAELNVPEHFADELDMGEHIVDELDMSESSVEELEMGELNMEELNMNNFNDDSSDDLLSEEDVELTHATEDVNESALESTDTEESAEEDEVDNDDNDDDTSVEQNTMGENAGFLGSSTTVPLDGACDRNQSPDYMSSLAMVCFVRSGKVELWPTAVEARLRFHLRRSTRDYYAAEQNREVLEELGHRCCILRTYEEDIEMLSINQDDGAAVLCRDPIRWYGLLIPHLRFAKRLNMILHVPELSLVVIGSVIGRVILLTPTRSPYGIEANGFTVKNGYRIDWILPTRDDEKAGRRPASGLYGIAVGPVPESDAPGCLLRSEDAPVPSPALRRYRLMLHYRDHRILSYDIGRDDKGEHLLIF